MYWKAIITSSTPPHPPKKEKEKENKEKEKKAYLTTAAYIAYVCWIRFESVLSTLEDAVNDAPKAAEFLGHLFAKVIVENVIPLRDIGKLIYEGGEEPGRLLEIGLAAEVLGSVLEMIKLEKGESVLSEIRMGSDLKFEDFQPPDPRKSRRLDKFMI